LLDKIVKSGHKERDIYHRLVRIKFSQKVEREEVFL